MAKFDFLKALTVVLNVLGVFLPEDVFEILEATYYGAFRKIIPGVILRGVPGTGKTTVAEAFAEAVGAKLLTYQCNAATGVSELIGAPNLAGVLRRDADRCIADGIVIQAVKEAMAGESVVLLLDEIDKASPEVDTFLLRFLLERKIHDSTMQELYVPEGVKLWVFLTSNEERDISVPFMRRLRRITLERPSRSVMAKALGIEESAALLDVAEAIEGLAISQMREYLLDGGDPEDLNFNLLSQYCDIKELANDVNGHLKEVTQKWAPLYKYVSFYNNKLNTEAFIKRGLRFKANDHDHFGIEVEVGTLSDLLRLFQCADFSAMDHNYGNGNSDERIVFDWLSEEPVMVSEEAAVLKYGEDLVAVHRDKFGEFYLTGHQLFRDDGVTLNRIAQKFKEEFKEEEFRAKQAQRLQEARKEASVDQAFHLLKRMGLDDLV